MFKHPAFKHLAGLAVSALLIGLLAWWLTGPGLAELSMAQVRRWCFVGGFVIVFVVSATLQLRWFETFFGLVGLFLPGREDRSESGFTIFGNRRP
jgi:hypothetical protein